MGAAILLSVLGVPWETVVEDYLLTNHYRQHADAKLLQRARTIAAERRGIDPADVDMTNVEALLGVCVSNLEAGREEILLRFGSFDNFIREGLGCSESDVSQLQDDLLE